MDNENLVTGYLERVQSDCPNAIARIELKGNQVTMGRGIGNTVIWESLQISRRHAVMEFANNRWKIKDTSTNGMLVNSRRMPQNLLQDINDGDIISFVPTGALQYKFVRVHPPKHTSQLSLQPTLNSIVESSTSHRSESVIVSPPSQIKSPKRKSGPNDPQNPEKKRKRVGFHAVNSVVDVHSSSVEDEEELLDIDEIPHCFEHLQPLSTSTPQIKKYNENEFELLSPPSDDPSKMKVQLLRCQQRIREMEDERRKVEHNRFLELQRLKNIIDSSETEKVLFQEELYKQAMEVIEHEFSCCICNEIFVQATVIDCGHTFCAHCISEWMKRKMECPNCRKPVKNQAKHVEVENLVTRFHSLFSDEIRTKREQLIKDRKKEVDAAAKAEADRIAAARQRPRNPTPMEFEPPFDILNDLAHFREVFAVPPGRMHPPFIPGNPDFRPLNFNIPISDFIRAHQHANAAHQGGVPVPPPANSNRRRSQRININPERPVPVAQPGPRNHRGRGVQQIVDDRPLDVVLRGPMDILTVD